MSKGYIFCTKCGAKNSADSKFCVKCGSKLVNNLTGNNESNKLQGNDTLQFNSDLVHPKQGGSRNKSILWWVLAIAIVIVIGIAGYQNHLKQQRADIRSYVYDELNKDDFKVKIDQNDRSITVVPESSEIRYALRYIALEDADGDDADDMDDSVKNISKKVYENEGKGWTVSLQNPDNSKRFFWIYKDGKAKYRMQDHAVSYDSYGDYGDEYDFDD